MKAVISNIQFAPMGEADIRALSVIEITSSKIDEAGSVSDPRLGSLSSQSTTLGLKSSKEFCVTCKLEESQCPNHMSFIRLKYPIIHPLFAKFVLKILRMFCYNCGRFLHPKVDGTFPHFDSVVIDKTKCICPHCCAPQPTWSFVEEAIRIKCSFPQRDLYMSPSDLQIMLMNVDKDDLRRIALTTQPENFIITLLPVCPPCTRPPLYIDGQLHDDHLTVQYNEIVKINGNLPDTIDEKSIPDLKKLTYKITSLFVEKSKAGSAVGSATKPVIKRLSGKKGYMRDSIMGKRVDKSGRTVIGPEPTLLIHQMAIPEEMARVLTVKEEVTEYNLHELNARIRDYYFIARKTSAGVQSFNATYVADDFRLQVGDELDRPLRDGDIVMANRQPTLHKGSLMAFSVIVRAGRTIRFNLSNTKTFNADFDGDEMNIHVPQKYNTRCELEELSSVKNHLLSERNGKPNIVLVQDNLLALYLMTYENMRIAREELYDLCLFLVDEEYRAWNMERIVRRLETLEPHFLVPESQEWQSRAVFSLCFPANFSYRDEQIWIEKGIHRQGYFSKSIMMKLFDVLYHLYPSAISEMVVNNLQILSNEWLKIRGFSVGLEDCHVKDPNVKRAIEMHVEKGFCEAHFVEETTLNPQIREVKVQEILNKAQAVGLRITKEGFSPANNFISMIQSGSKGDYFNVAQICGLLGQQYIEGARNKPDLNNGTRTLYHYPFELDRKDTYPARGFIRSNFLGGLQPRDLYFHAEAGRAGVVDTAMGTSVTGYMHRRIIKLAEDAKVTYDGTVRDDIGNILQFQYGNGLAITKSPEAKHIHHLVEMLNADYEALSNPSQLGQVAEV